MKRSTEFKSKINLLESTNKEQSETIERLTRELVSTQEKYSHLDKYKNEYESNLDRLQQQILSLEEELQVTKSNINENKFIMEREFWKVCILEILTQLLGCTIHDLEKQTFAVLDLTSDRVRLHNLVDSLYKTHQWNNIISHVVEKVASQCKLEFSKQE